MNPIPRREVLERRFDRPLHVSSVDKQLSLGEAVRRFVAAGMSLDVAYLQGRPNALVHELALLRIFELDRLFLGRVRA